MKVVLDGIVFSLQMCGGISGMFSRLLSSLLQRGGVEVYLLERPDARRNLFRGQVKVPESQIIKENTPLLPFRYLSVNSLPCNIANGEPFIFHSSYYRYCTVPGVVNVTTLHDFTYEVMRMRGKLPTLAHSWQKKRAVSRSTAVVCVSNSTLGDCESILRIPPGQLMEVIPNAPLCEPISLGDRERKMMNVLFVGARDYHKNFRLVVEALADSPYRLIICSSPLRADELRLLEEKLRPGKWEIREYADDATLSELYKTCRCLLYPSSYEGFGIPIIEAQAHGCPVITGNCPASLEIGGGAAVVISDYTPEAMRKAISSLDSESLREKLIADGRKNASRYNWDSIIDSYVSLYRRAIIAKSNHE